MALENPNVVDAAGIENGSGLLVLTIADSWDWEDERKHLSSLQEKLNAYFNFIETGEIWESYPDSAGHPIVIDVVGKFEMPQAGIDLLERAAVFAAELGVTIRKRHYRGSSKV